jgi:hypothetical protein
MLNNLLLIYLDDQVIIQTREIEHQKTINEVSQITNTHIIEYSKT